MRENDFYIFVPNDLLTSNSLPQLLVSIVMSPPYLKFLRLSDFQQIVCKGTGRRTDGRVQRFVWPLGKEDSIIIRLENSNNMRKRERERERL